MSDEERRKDIVFVAGLPRERYLTAIKLISDHGDYQALLDVAEVVRDQAQAQLDDNERFLEELTAEIERGPCAFETMYQGSAPKGPEDPNALYNPPRPLPNGDHLANDSVVVSIRKPRNQLR